MQAPLRSSRQRAPLQHQDDSIVHVRGEESFTKAEHRSIPAR